MFSVHQISWYGKTPTYLHSGEISGFYEKNWAQENSCKIAQNFRSFPLSGMTRIITKWVTKDYKFTLIERLSHAPLSRAHPNMHLKVIFIVAQKICPSNWLQKLLQRYVNSFETLVYKNCKEKFAINTRYFGLLTFAIPYFWYICYFSQNFYSEYTTKSGIQ